jgi:AcrR family transcriptional regulator
MGALLVLGAAQSAIPGFRINPGAPLARAGRSPYDPPMSATPARAQTRKFELKRETILDAAAALFNRKGLRGATLGDVAGSVGLITTSVTYYYKKKDDLAAACLERGIEVIDDLIDQAEAAAPPERVRAFIRLFFAMVADIAAGRRPEIVNFSDFQALRGPRSEPVREAYANLVRRLRGMSEPLAEGVFSRAEQNIRANLLLRLVLWSRHWLHRYEPDDYGRAADRMADVLLEGLAAPGAIWRPAEVATARLESSSPAEVSREAFLRAATRLVNEQGYHGASVTAIAARLNVTKGSFYHHNDTKADLVGECFERSFEVVRRAQRAALDAGGSGWDRLAATVQALVRYQLSPEGPLLRSTALAAIPESMRPGAERAMDRLTERFAGMIVDGIADGSIRPVDPSIAAELVNEMISSAASRYVASELPKLAPADHPSDAWAAVAQPLLIGMWRSA